MSPKEQQVLISAREIKEAISNIADDDYVCIEGIFGICCFAEIVAVKKDPYRENTSILVVQPRR
jgi:hypothetical protein